MMSLIKLLPLMVGDLIDDSDDHWICFLTLWDICGMVLMFEVTEADSRHLSWLVEIYLESFRQLYNYLSLPPKFHYLVHFGHQILMYVKLACIILCTVIIYLLICRFGPLRHQWCMRFESKNAQIKRFVSKSFLNIPLTVSTHHQQWMCHEMATHAEQTHSNVFYCGDEITSGIYCCYLI